MGENTHIEWCDHTFNPWIGCSKVSPGCEHCYAEKLMDKRMGKVKWGPQGTRLRTSDANWRKPVAWNRKAAEAGVMHRVFCASLADVFEDRPEVVGWRSELFELIRATPNLVWLLLTKRPENVMSMAGSIPYNVWLGTSVENQATADERVPHLLGCPAALRFVSVEPLLGPVDFERGGWSLLRRLESPRRKVHWERGVDWIIVGGESGPKARPMHPQWARSIRDQCREAGVPFFFKQWGEWTPRIPDFGQLGRDDIIDMNGDDGAAPCYVMRVGKRAAGHLLDGAEHREFPKTNKEQSDD